MWENIIGIMILSPFGVMFWALGRLMFEKPFWPQIERFKRDQKKDLLDYIEYKRNKDVRRFHSLYPSKEEWNRRELEDTIDHFIR